MKSSNRFRYSGALSIRLWACEINGGRMSQKKPTMIRISDANTHSDAAPWDRPRFWRRFTSGPNAVASRKASTTCSRMPQIWISTQIRKIATTTVTIVRIGISIRVTVFADSGVGSTVPTKGRIGARSSSPDSPSVSSSSALTAGKMSSPMVYCSALSSRLSSRSRRARSSGRSSRSPSRLGSLSRPMPCPLRVLKN